MTDYFPYIVVIFFGAIATMSIEIITGGIIPSVTYLDMNANSSTIGYTITLFSTASSISVSCVDGIQIKNPLTGIITTSYDYGRYISEYNKLYGTNLTRC